MHPAIKHTVPSFSFAPSPENKSGRVITSRYLDQPIVVSNLSPRPIDDSTADYLKLGRKVIFDIRNKYVPGGIINSMSHVHATHGENRVRGIMMMKWIKENRSVTGKYDDDPTLPRVYGRGAIRHGVATCDELAGLSYSLLAAQCLKEPVSRWIDKTGSHAGVDIGDVREKHAVRVCPWAIFADASLEDESKFELGRILDQHPANTPVPANIPFDPEKELAARISTGKVVAYIEEKNKEKEKSHYHSGKKIPGFGDELVKHHFQSEIDNAKLFRIPKMFEQLFGVKKPVTVYRSDKYGVQYFNVPPADSKLHQHLEDFFVRNPNLREGLKYETGRGFDIPGLKK